MKKAPHSTKAQKKRDMLLPRLLPILPLTPPRAHPCTAMQKTVAEQVKEGQYKLRPASESAARRIAAAGGATGTADDGGDAGGPDIVAALRNKFRNMRRVESDEDDE